MGCSALGLLVSGFGALGVGASGLGLFAFLLQQHASFVTAMFVLVLPCTLAEPSATNFCHLPIGLREGVSEGLVHCVGSLG